MDYTAVQSGIFDALNSIGNVVFIAGVIMASIFAAQILAHIARRLKTRRTSAGRLPVIAPYNPPPATGRPGAMQPCFSRKPAGGALGLRRQGARP